MVLHKKSRPSTGIEEPAQAKKSVYGDDLGYSSNASRQATANQPTDDTPEASLTVQGFTPYAQIPTWLLRAGDQLSHGAVRLYGVIMSYADNTSRTAFPGQEKLSKDLGVSDRSVRNYMKELEDYGALKVQRRRNKRTGSYYANSYALVFNPPSETGFRWPEETGFRITKPTVLTKPTHSTSDPSESDEEHFTCTTSCDTRDDDHLPKDQYLQLRGLLQQVGKSIQQTRSFRHPETQDYWHDFQHALEEHTQHLPYGDVVMDLVTHGKWSVSAHVADQYQAGKELTVLLNTARNH